MGLPFSEVDVKVTAPGTWWCSGSTSALNSAEYMFIGIVVTRILRPSTGQPQRVHPPGFYGTPPSLEHNREWRPLRRVTPGLLRLSGAP